MLWFSDDCQNFSFGFYWFLRVCAGSCEIDLPQCKIHFLFITVSACKPAFDFWNCLFSSTRKTSRSLPSVASFYKCMHQPSLSQSQPGTWNSGCILPEGSRGPSTWMLIAASRDALARCLTGSTGAWSGKGYGHPQQRHHCITMPAPSSSDFSDFDNPKEQWFFLLLNSLVCVCGGEGVKLVMINWIETMSLWKLKEK